MKIISRHLLSNLLRPWTYILLGFSSIIVLIDLIDNFSSFVEEQTPFARIAGYYAALVSTYLPYLLPISLLLALLYALWRLSKFSELVAMRASGLSLFQLASPYLALGLACALFLALLNDLFNPWAARWTRCFRETQSKGADVANIVPVAFKSAAGRRVWNMESFDIRPSSDYEMRALSLIQHRPDDSIEFRMDVRRARWLNEHWWFEHIELQYFGPDNEPDGPKEIIPAMNMTMLSEKPRDFLNETKDPNNNEWSVADIHAFIEDHPDMSDAKRRSLLVDAHMRLASPWLCLIVMLIGIPFGMQTGRRGMGAGIFAALLVFFAYYVLMGLGMAWGKKLWIPPWLAGWLPCLAFSLLSLPLLRRAR